MALPPSSVFFFIAMAGYIILIASRNATLSYIAVYLAAAYVPHLPSQRRVSDSTRSVCSGIYPNICKFGIARRRFVIIDGRTIDGH
jgi:hypothetical protein